MLTSRVERVSICRFHTYLAVDLGSDPTWYDVVKRRPNVPSPAIRVVRNRLTNSFGIGGSLAASELTFYAMLGTIH
jgi:hypothetical protein